MHKAKNQLSSIIQQYEYFFLIFQVANQLNNYFIFCVSEEEIPTGVEFTAPNLNTNLNTPEPMEDPEQLLEDDEEAEEFIVLDADHVCHLILQSTFTK